jgi:hypothetical protein
MIGPPAPGDQAPGNGQPRYVRGVGHPGDDDPLEAQRARLASFWALVLRRVPRLRPARRCGRRPGPSAGGQLYLAGLMRIVCPVGDGSGTAGVSIFDADPDEVDQMMRQDPGVKAGLFTYEIHPTQTFPESRLTSASPAP